MAKRKKGRTEGKLKKFRFFLVSFLLVCAEEWMHTMLVSILITSGIPRQTRTDISRVLQSVNQWLYPKIWALIIQEKMPLIYV